MNERPTPLNLQPRSHRLDLGERRKDRDHKQNRSTPLLFDYIQLLIIVGEI
jgi:hypothetical protein